MKKINLASALYTGMGDSNVRCSRTELKIGMELSTPAAFSEHRPTVGTAKIKISNIAIALDHFFEDRQYRFAAFDTGIYIEETAKDGVIGFSEPSQIHLSKVHLPTFIALLFLHELVFGKNNELRTIFNECITAYNASGKIETVSIAALCDSFYYGNAKVLQVTGSVGLECESTEEIKAAIRQKTFRHIELLQRIGCGKPSAITIAEKTEKKPKIKKELKSVLEDCKNGEYLIDYHWDESQDEYRQDLSALDGYIPNEEFRAILNKIKFRTDRILQRMKGFNLSNGTDRVKAIGQDYINLTLSGKPGTGKTKLAYAIASATGLPIYTISCSHNSDEDEFQGMTKMVDGVPRCVETDTVRCVEDGGILLLEEANLPQAAVMMGALGQLVEFPFILKKFGYQTIRRHPLCIVITTMNTGTAGSKVMSQPFANRFKQSFVLEDPSKEDFIQILINATGAERNVCRWVYECYERITNCVEDDNGIADVESILLSLSMRSCIGAIENIQEGMTAREAITCSIVGKIYEQDKEVAESCCRALNSMRDPEFE